MEITQLIVVAFIALVPAVFLTVLVGFLWMFLGNVWMLKIRKQVLQDSKETVLTETMVERKLAQDYPKFYTFWQELPAWFLGAFLVIYIISYLCVALMI